MLGYSSKNNYMRNYGFQYVSMLTGLFNICKEILYLYVPKLKLLSS